MTELKLNLDIYSLKNIKRAISAYRDYADIKTADNSNCIILYFDKCRHNEALTVKEFECYLIGLENS